jgi:hypothetical protein
MSASTLRVFAESWLAIAGVGQLILLWLQLRALIKFRHTSFRVLAIGTVLGLVYTCIMLAVYLAPTLIASPRELTVIAMLIGLIQIPMAVWGVAWLFRSYGEILSRSAVVLPNTSLERTREG